MHVPARKWFVHVPDHKWFVPVPGRKGMVIVMVDVVTDG